MGTPIALAESSTIFFFQKIKFFFFLGAGNDPASKITITLATTSATAGNRF